MVKFYEGDYEYEEAAILQSHVERLQGDLRVPEYEKFVVNYVQSMGRIQAFHLFPFNLMLQMNAQAISHAIAVMHAGHDPTDLDYDFTPEDGAFAQAAFLKMVDQIRAAPGGWNNYMFKYGQVMMKDIVAMQPHNMTGAIVGIEATLAAMITAAYGALETLASDLWIAAGNRHSKLAENWIEKNARQFDGSVLVGHGFDLRGRMGLMLTQTRKVQFVSFSEIKKAYGDSFRESVAEAFATDKDVFVTEKVRNLIAHRAGIVDAKFKEEMIGNPEYQMLDVGEQIHFTGLMVKNRVMACLNLATALVKAVDGWSAVAPVG